MELADEPTSAHEEVLQQVVVVLLLSPVLDSLDDILGVLEDSLAVGANSSGSRASAATGLEGVRVKNDGEKLGDLVLRTERAWSVHLSTQ